LLISILRCWLPPLLVLMLALALVFTAPSAQARSGPLDPDRLIQFTDVRGEQISGGVWLPHDTAAGPRPLVIISHGNGGWFMGHSDTARALADAGFVVAALTHPGDNYQDQSRALNLTARAPQLSALIDYMTTAWSGPVAIDPERIGAFGFSAGGFTVTSIIGGESDPQAILNHCAAEPEVFACRLLSLFGGLNTLDWRPRAHDPRAKAAVIAAPALGMSFTTDSLAAVTLPVQLWQAGEDEILPSPFNVEPIRDRLGRAPEYHRVDGAMHYDFLQPCNDWTARELPELCVSSPGFDRAAFKASFNREVVRFFREALNRP
jgi:predicted dienelactone hydrolase